MKIMILIDCQNDFITGPLGSKEAVIAADNIAKYIQEYNDYNKTLLLYTKDTHYTDYLETAEGKVLPNPHCIEGTPGWSIYKSISSEADYGKYFCVYSAEDIRNSRILKNTFGSERLIEVLKDVSKNYHIESIEFMGFCTDICIVSNILMTKAALPETPILVRASCCAGTTPEAHEAALKVMHSCQIEIID